MSDDAAGTRRRPDALELVGVFVLSITAVLTAWCGFESSKWGSEMSVAFSTASSARVNATHYDGIARDDRALDLTVYAQWVAANGAQNAELADYIQARFRPGFLVAFDAWVEGGRVESSPFAREDYVPRGTVEAIEYAETADEEFANALVHSERSGNYSLLTVLFALVLFFAAMAQRGITRWMSRALLGIAIAVGLVGVALMVTFPITL